MAVAGRFKAVCCNVFRFKGFNFKALCFGFDINGFRLSNCCFDGIRGGARAGDVALLAGETAVVWPGEPLRPPGNADPDGELRRAVAFDTFDGSGAPVVETDRVILRLTTGDGVGPFGSIFSIARRGRSGVETPTVDAGPMRRSLGAGCTASQSSSAAPVAESVLAAAALASTARNAAAPFRGGEAALPKLLEFWDRGVFDEGLAVDKLSGLQTAVSSRAEDMDDTGATAAVSSATFSVAASSRATAEAEDPIAPRPTLAVNLGATGGHGAAPHEISVSACCSFSALSAPKDRAAGRSVADATDTDDIPAPDAAGTAAGAAGGNVAVSEAAASQRSWTLGNLELRSPQRRIPKKP